MVIGKIIRTTGKVGWEVVKTTGKVIGFLGAVAMKVDAAKSNNGGSLNRDEFIKETRKAVYKTADERAKPK